MGRAPRGPAKQPAPEVKAAFQFKDSTPNLRDKVIWCPSNNAFKILLNVRDARGLKTRWYDENEMSLGVPEGLSADQHEAAKKDAYSRAISAWNALDAGKRHRIREQVANMEMC